jgi:hypothetical protein
MKHSVAHRQDVAVAQCLLLLVGTSIPRSTTKVVSQRKLNVNRAEMRL